MRRFILFVFGLSVALLSNDPVKAQAKKSPVKKFEVQTVIEPRLPTESERTAVLEQKLVGVLPAGTSVNEASRGFRNQGQFVAAAHASRNLGIPFADLKARMISAESMSLVGAIQTLRPDLSEERTEVEVRKAEKVAADFD